MEPDMDAPEIWRVTTTIRPEQLETLTLEEITAEMNAWLERALAETGRTAASTELWCEPENACYVLVVELAG